MTDSTAIESLPGPGANNVKLSVQERPPVQGQGQVPVVQQGPQMNGGEKPTVPFTPAQMDPDSLNKVLQGIQQAQQHGSMQLPSRDIPMNAAALATDEQIKPNYLPESDAKKYIEEQDTYQSMMEKNKHKHQQQDRLDVLYDEFQLPILIMVLFFIFQLPFVQTKLSSFFPKLFLKDGHMSMGGYMTKTLMFGATFYTIMKLTKYASEL